MCTPSIVNSTLLYTVHCTLYSPTAPGFYFMQHVAPLTNLMSSYNPAELCRSTVQCAAVLQCSAVECSALFYTVYFIPYTCVNQVLYTVHWYTPYTVHCTAHCTRVLFHAACGPSDKPYVFIQLCSAVQCCSALHCSGVRCSAAVQRNPLHWCSVAFRLTVVNKFFLMCTTYSIGEPRPQQTNKQKAQLYTCAEPSQKL